MMVRVFSARLKPKNLARQLYFPLSQKVRGKFARWEIRICIF
jgi:hypothetical protein